MNATDDAYNKFLGEDASTGGTLMGNWQEERVLREVTGEGRSIPQRHVRRSGLLKDFTKLPTDGFREGDSTFERVYGKRVYDAPLIGSMEVGSYFVSGNLDLKAQLSAEETGPREQAQIDWARKTSDAMQTAIEEEEYKAYVDPLDTTQRLSYARPSLKQDSDEYVSRTDVKTVDSYVHDPAITYYSSQANAAKPSDKQNVYLTAATGVHFFGRNSHFSEPPEHAKAPAHKIDWASKAIDGAMAKTRDAHTAYGSDVALRMDGGLIDLRRAILQGLLNKDGVLAVAKLRSKLNATADYNGFVSVSEVCREFCSAEIKESDVRTYLHPVRINGQVSTLTLLESVRPAVAADKKACLAAAGLSLNALQSGSVVVPEVAFEVAEFNALVGELKTDMGLTTLYQDIASILNLEDLTAVLPIPAPKEEAPVAEEAAAEGAAAEA